MQNIHMHVWDQARHFTRESIAETELSRGRPLDLTVHFETLMEDAGAFDKAIVFGLKARRCGYWVPDDYVAAFARRAPGKLIGFASCDPAQGHCMEELRVAIEDFELRGVKIGPAYAGVDPRDSRCDPVYEYCQERGLPVIFHCGTTFSRMACLEYSRPVVFDQVARQWPGLTMVLAHLGHPWCAECCAVIRKHPRMFADISALYYRPWQFYNALISAQEYNVTHKLLFGTDYPFASGAESVAGLRSVNEVASGSMPRVDDKVIEEILTRDSVSLLGLEGDPE